MFSATLRLPKETKKACVHCVSDCLLSLLSASSPCYSRLEVSSSDCRRLPAWSVCLFDLRRERKDIVLKTAAMLGLTDLLDALIGSPELGLYVFRLIRKTHPTHPPPNDPPHSSQTRATDNYTHASSPVLMP